tara:strand:+ start:14781 stop:15101 length:321 start_codon:yes stop_codon:yes gene_type:complete
LHTLLVLQAWRSSARATADITPGNAEGAIFVQCSKVNDFKAACSGEQFTLDVSEHFQYGQDKAQTKRFLVFHDKGNKAYQVRDEHAGVVLEGLTVLTASICGECVE